MNDNAARALDAYLGSNPAVPHAFLLEGPWGSGKTHFMRSYFADRDRAAQKRSALHLPGPTKPIVVSLFGLTRTAEIQRRILEATAPAGVEVAALVGAAADATSFGKLVSVATGHWERNLQTELRERVLVFDDLERCEAPLGETMGFINLIVEQHGRHVIVIASEEVMRDRHGEVWDERCEKLVGRRARVEPVADVIIDRFAHVPLVTDHGDAIAAVFARSKLSNLRSLSWALENVERVAAALPDGIYPDGHKRGIVETVVAATLELRANRIKPGDLKRAKNYTARSIVREMNKRTGDAKPPKAWETRLTGFIERYRGLDLAHPRIDYAFVTTLETRGTIDAPALAKAQGERFGIGADHEVPAWRALWHRWQLEPDAYEQAVNELADELANRVLVDAGTILHAAGLAIELSGFGDDRLTAGMDPVDFFTTYAADVRRTERLEPFATDGIDRFGLGGGYDGLGYASVKEQRFRTIFDVMIKENDRRWHDLRVAEVKRIMAAVRADPPQLAALDTFHLVPSDFRLHARAVLTDTDFDAAEFADTMSASVTHLDAFRKFMSYRYYELHMNRALEDEAAWALNAIERVRALIPQRFPEPISSIQRDALDNWLEKAEPALKRVVAEKKAAEREAAKEETAA